MSEFNLEKYLSVERMKLLEDQKRYKEMIEELEQTNHELIEKNKKLLKENEELKNGNEHYGKIIESLEEEKKKLNDVIMQYENQNLELMKKDQEQEKEIKRLRKLNDALLAENSYLQDNGERYKLENERMKRRLKEKGIDWI